MHPDEPSIPRVFCHRLSRKIGLEFFRFLPVCDALKNRLFSMHIRGYRLLTKACIKKTNSGGHNSSMFCFCIILAYRPFVAQSSYSLTQDAISAVLENRPNVYSPDLTSLLLRCKSLFERLFSRLLHWAVTIVCPCEPCPDDVLHIACKLLARENRYLSQGLMRKLAHTPCRING